MRINRNVCSTALFETRRRRTIMHKLWPSLSLPLWHPGCCVWDMLLVSVGKLRLASQHTSPKWPEFSSSNRILPLSLVTKRLYPRFHWVVEHVGMASLQSAQAVADRVDIHKSCRALEAIVNLLDDYSEAARAVVTLHKKLAKALKDAAAVKPTAEIPGTSSCTFGACHRRTIRQATRSTRARASLKCLARWTPSSPSL